MFIGGVEAGELHHLLWRKIKEHLWLLWAVSVCSGHSKSQKHPTEATWEIILPVPLNWNLWEEAEKQITPGLSLFLRTLWVNAKCVPFDPTGNQFSFTEKVCVYFHLWNHGLQVLGGHRATKYARGHLALLLTLSLSALPHAAGLGTRRQWTLSCLWHWSALWPWTNLLHPLGLSFHICLKKGVL